MRVRYDSILALTAILTSTLAATPPVRPKASRAPIVCDMINAKTCPGLLPPQFEADPSVAKVKEAFNKWQTETIGFSAVWRRGKCGAADCPEGPITKPIVNIFARTLEIADIPAHRLFAIAAFNYPYDETNNDFRYKVGASTRGVDAILAIRNEPPFTRGGKRYHGFYLIFGHRPGIAGIAALDSGWIQDCHHTKYEGIKIAKFIGCDGANYLKTLADSFNLPFNTVLAAGDCASPVEAKKGTCGTPEARQVALTTLIGQRFSTPQLQSRKVDALKYIKLFADADERFGELWFSCGAGCCSAGAFF